MQIYVIVQHVVKLGVSKETRLERWEESKREENWNKIEQCVNETKGKIVTYDGKPINAFFSC